MAPLERWAIRHNHPVSDVVALGCENLPAALLTCTASSESSSPMPTRLPPVDGRSSRWDDHREARRAELVAAAIDAVDEYGPGVSVAQIAASAGVSKPVLYRYFTDKEDLLGAIGRSVAEDLLGRISEMVAEEVDPRALIHLACQEFVSFIDEHPHVFGLILVPRDGETGAQGSRDEVAASVAKVLGDAMRRHGVDAGGAEPWAHGLIGFTLAVGEWHIRRDILSTEATASYLAEFIWNALAGVTGPGEPRRLRVLPGEADRDDEVPRPPSGRGRRGRRS